MCCMQRQFHNSDNDGTKEEGALAKARNGREAAPAATGGDVGDGVRLQRSGLRFMLPTEEHECLQASEQ